MADLLRFRAHEVTAEERLSWARERVLDAARRLAAAPDDRAWHAALIGRVQEYDRTAAFLAADLRPKTGRPRKHVTRNRRAT